MDGSNEVSSNGEVENHALQIIRYSPYQPCCKLPSSWFDLRVFYVRISNFKVDDSTPKFLTLHHIPVSPDTLLEVNGAKTSIHSEGVSSHLRRDRVDKKSEEATFVNTDSIRLTGSARFEVYDKDDLILSGVLEMSNSNGFIGESKNNVKRWSMNCESDISACTGFLKGKHLCGAELTAPTIEVYITGCFSGTPIILTKTLQLHFRKKHNGKSTLGAIPEYETTECQKDVSPGVDMEVPSDLKLYSGMVKLSPLLTLSYEPWNCLPVLPAQKRTSCSTRTCKQNLILWHMGIMGRAQFSSDGVVFNLPVLSSFSYPCWSQTYIGLIQRDVGMVRRCGPHLLLGCCRQYSEGRRVQKLQAGERGRVQQYVLEEDGIYGR